ncbi:eyes absent homolog [Cynara cardunculus var. scolymus]|uniref:eyes absent homolog n=1 Tax=Cynara cardunculus var. scolymus TaxID=59895 RepID=UPI000D626F93|nr:eyes absent homolog [Cynara cardunculus var. scolymus]
MDQKINVFVWDMDETLVLLKSLITGTYAKAFNGSKDVQKGIEIGKTWENQILRICDDHFFYEQIESCNKPYVDAMREYDDGLDLTDYDFANDGFVGASFDDDDNKRKLAYRHRLIAHKYKKGLRSVFGEKMIKSWDNLYEVTDDFTDKWLSSARTCVAECASGTKDVTPLVDSTSSRTQNVNVIVTSGSLIPSLVKCLLFRLDDLISYENVYSSWEVGKYQCFSLIKERFNGPNVQFCAIGDGWEECEAAENMQWPFVQIDPGPVSTSHRFPGLTVETLGHYIGVVYGESDDDDDDDDE